MKQELEGCKTRFHNPDLDHYSNNEEEIKTLVLNKTGMTEICQEEKPFFDNYTKLQEQVGLVVCALNDKKKCELFKCNKLSSLIYQNESSDLFQLRKINIQFYFSQNFNNNNKYTKLQEQVGLVVCCCQILFLLSLCRFQQKKIGGNQFENLHFCQ